MTDEQLLELVQSTSPSELTREQIQLLEQRLAESADLRQLFQSRLKLQRYWIEVLARRDDSASAPGLQPAERSAIRWWLPSLVAAAGLVVVGGVLAGMVAWSPRSGRDRQSEPAAASVAAAPSTGGTQEIERPTHAPAAGAAAAPDPASANSPQRAISPTPRDSATEPLAPRQDLLSDSPDPPPTGDVSGLLADPELARAELLRLVYGERWQETLAFCRLLRSHDLHKEVPLFEWAAALASRQHGDEFGGGMVSRQRGSWRELMVDQTSREVYRVSTEIDALLASGAYDEASETIAALGPSDARGTAPAAGDPRLLVSLPTLMRIALGDHPALQQRIVQQADSLAQLRVQQAIAAQDVAALELAAVQFAGTAAAARAHRWLGDRALAAGWFDTAWLQHQRAGGIADRERAEWIRSAAVARRLPVPPTPAPGSYEAQPVDGLAEPAGRPAGELNPELLRFEIDAIGRQLALSVEDDAMYVSNRFHVAAFDLGTGQPRWRSGKLPGRVAGTLDWPLVAMRPVISGPRIFVRQLYGDGPSLACLDKASGATQWVSRHRPGTFLVSDPLVQHSELFCLTLTQGDQDQWILGRTTFDPETGAAWRDQQLIVLRDHWFARRVCQVRALADSFLVLLGGVTMCCDASGNIRWLRRHTVVPAESDASWVTQTFAPPVVQGERVFVSQPGVRSVDCLEAETGRAVWSQVIADVRGLLGAADERVLVQTDRGLMTLRAADGAAQWSRDLDRILYVHPWDGSPWLLCAVADEGPSGQVPQLVWLDARDGSTLHACRLPSLDDPQPCFGPLIAAEGHVWAFIGRGVTEPARELVELRLAGQTE